MIRELADRTSPGDVAQLLRKVHGDAPGRSISDLLGTACIALLARDPDLSPEDLFIRKGAR
jgi:hypothetical protein